MNNRSLGDSAPHADRFTQTEPRIGYVSRGDAEAPAVVLLHSLGTDRSIWDPVVALLEPRFRVVAWDSRGHGASARTGAIGPAEWVADLTRMLDELGIESAALVGVSMGGMQAMAFAGSHPERAWAIVVADSYAALTSEIADARIESQIELAKSVPMADVASAYLVATFADPASPAASAVGDAIAGMSAEDYIAAVQSCFRADVRSYLDAITAPTLVLWGDRDAKTPRPLSEAIAERIHGSRFAVIPDAGHLSNMDNPAAFAAEILAFLDAANTSHG
ncbi:3-oxoadipate enol-lactonase [Okibacterium endophyticum]